MGRLNVNITKEDIENYVSIVDVINRYTPLHPKYGKYIGNCPFHAEKTPSFHVKETGMFKCFGCGKGGVGVINFIMLKENLSFTDSIKFLSKDLSQLNLEKAVIIRKPKEDKPVVYDFVDMPFSKRHSDYFNAGGLSESFVTKEGDIYAVKKFAVNKKIIIIPSDRYMFCYVHKNIDGTESGGLKFLTLGKNVPKEDKWRTNVPNSQLWYLYKYHNTDCKQIFISKSNKDALINMAAGICSIATQSENAAILNNNIPKLKSLYPNTEFILNLGADKQGVTESKKVSEEYNLKWFNTPKKFLINDINDPFEYVKNFGMENYIKLLKKYKYK